MTNEAVVRAVKKELNQVIKAIDGDGTQRGRGIKSEVNTAHGEYLQAKQSYEFQKQYLETLLERKEELERWLEANDRESE